MCNFFGMFIFCALSIRARALLCLGTFSTVSRGRGPDPAPKAYSVANRARMPYMPISWGGLRGQLIGICRPVPWSVWVRVVNFRSSSSDPQKWPTFQQRLNDPIGYPIGTPAGS